MSWSPSFTTLASALLICSVIMLVVSAFSLPWLLARMHGNFFLPHYTPEPVPLWRRTLRNLGGAVLFCAGFAMLFLPGQGLLTMLAGLVLLDFPKKRAQLQRLTRTQSVRRSLDWLRGKGGAEPFSWPD